MELEYNTSRQHMVMKEYGRAVHKMVDYLLTIEEDQIRQKKTEALVDILGILFPPPKNVEVDTKLFWDHIIIMSNFQLKVKSPYPYPTPDEVYAKPDMLPYPQSKIRYKHMGKNFENLLNQALEEKDPEVQKQYIQKLAMYMKLAYKNWHNEQTQDELIREELKLMTGGKLIYSDDLFLKLTDNNKQPTIKNNLNYSKPKSKGSYSKKPIKKR